MYLGLIGSHIMQDVDFVMFHFKFKLNSFNCENEETSRVLL